MNVKFRMPRFWRQPKQNGIFKELLLTFIGTTLSIVLTFGTAQYLERKQLREQLTGPETTFPIQFST